MATKTAQSSRKGFQAPELVATPQVIRSTVFGILFFAAICLTVFASLQALSADPEQTKQAYPILLFNLGLIIALGLYLIVNVWHTLFRRTARRSAPLLHRRFVGIFSVAALIPAILIGAFSTSLISRNINDLFGQDVSERLSEANEFLNTYQQRELTELIPQSVAIQNFLEDNQRFFEDRISYTAYLQRFARGMDVDAIHVLNREGHIFSRVLSGRSPELKIPDSRVFAEAESPERSIGVGQSREEINYLIWIVKLNGYDDAFVHVGKYLPADMGVLSSISGIEAAERALDRYDEDQGLFRKIFFLTFLDTALLILIAAIWLGILLANRIIEPLGRLVDAAEKVRGGDLSARVAVRGEWGEISDLGSAFNRMTRQLSSQREDLVREHNVSEQRRQFSEAVLSGVRAGVIGMSEDGRITLMNASAEQLLGRTSYVILGHPIETALPEFAPAFFAARESVSGRYEDQIDFQKDEGLLHFDLRVSGYEDGLDETGWVITFDDMTRLVAAQRHSAWREVARRIAHEIKNPLTPILLSTERLKRKYSGKVENEPEVFDNCTDTIIRQVGSLEQMVNEFSTFARMPTPEFQIQDLAKVIDTILFAQGVAFPDVTFTLQNDALDAEISCDERLLSQALTNVYKNAAESISERVDSSGIDDPDGVISTRLSIVEHQVVIRIEDNGKGWPYPDRDRLLEPYVTTRDTGTGLGLAIVKRIIEDHGGHLSLSRRSDNASGAVVQLTLPVPDANTQSSFPLKRELKHEA